MVKHIVMFKLKEKSPENMEHAVSTLRGLDEEIETLRFLEVGVDFNKSERSYDIVLTTHFTVKMVLLHTQYIPVTCRLSIR